MYHVAACFEVPADRRDDFIAAALEDGRNSRSSETGTLRFELIEDDQERNRFYLNEAYVDRAAFRAHSKGRHFKAFFKYIREFVPPHTELFRGIQVEDDLPKSSDGMFCGEGDLGAIEIREKVGVSPALRASIVTFPPGTRTRWHVHSDGQILWVVSGEGWLEIEGTDTRRLRPGDAVLVHAGHRHWHGSTKDAWLEHLAVTEGTTHWFESSHYPEAATGI